MGWRRERTGAGDGGVLSGVRRGWDLVAASSWDGGRRLSRGVLYEGWRCWFSFASRRCIAENHEYELSRRGCLPVDDSPRGKIGIETRGRINSPQPRDSVISGEEEPSPPYPYHTHTSYTNCPAPSATDPYRPSRPVTTTPPQRRKKIPTTIPPSSSRLSPSRNQGSRPSSHVSNPLPDCAPTPTSDQPPDLQSSSGIAAADTLARPRSRNEAPRGDISER